MKNTSDDFFVSSKLSCSTDGETDEDRIPLQAMRGEKA